MSNVALVAGATGTIGSAVLQTLIDTPGWRIRPLRRQAYGESLYTSVDLTDAAATFNALADKGDTTHAFFAAGSADINPLVRNDIDNGMLRNVLEGLKRAHAPLERVVLFQGAKQYPAHFGESPSLAFNPRLRRGSFPRLSFDQTELLRARSVSQGFEWSVLRPDPVVSDGGGFTFNIAMVLGVYAALRQAEGPILRFPGSPFTYREVESQTTDADWLGRAGVWAATEPAARNRAFNSVGSRIHWGAGLCSPGSRVRDAAGRARAHLPRQEDADQDAAVAADCGTARSEADSLSLAGELAVRR